LVLHLPISSIGAAFLGSTTGIPFENMRHAEYVNSWLQILNSNNRAIFTAAAKAQAAADFVLDKKKLRLDLKLLS
jgi:antirestriction protein ArdC